MQSHAVTNKKKITMTDFCFMIRNATYDHHFSKHYISWSHDSIIPRMMSLVNVHDKMLLSCSSYTGWPNKNGTVDTVDFSELCSDQQLSFFTLLDRTSFPHYNNTKIIKFGWELFILWVISYGLSFSGFARFPEFRGTINDGFGRP